MDQTDIIQERQYKRYHMLIDIVREPLNQGRHENDNVRPLPVHDLYPRVSNHQAKYIESLTSCSTAASQAVFHGDFCFNHRLAIA